MIRYSVRINLADFLGTQHEECIVRLVQSIGEETNKSIYLKLWYNKGEIADEDLVQFIKKYETVLEDIGTNIHVGEHEVWTQKSWFNLRKRGTTTTTEYRHEYFYNNAYGILQGLAVFRSMILKMDDIKNIQPSRPERKSESQGRGYKVSIRKVAHDTAQHPTSEHTNDHPRCNRGQSKVDGQTED